MRQGGGREGAGGGEGRGGLGVGSDFAGGGAAGAGNDGLSKKITAPTFNRRRRWSRRVDSVRRPSLRRKLPSIRHSNRVLSLTTLHDWIDRLYRPEPDPSPIPVRLSLYVTAAKQ